jgi:hypothetical protein
MRSAVLLLSALGLSVAAGLGCSARGDADGAASALTDEEIQTAKDMVNMLAGKAGRCNQCHTAGKEDLVRWGQAMISVEVECMRKEGLTPAQRVACLSNDPNDPEASFSAHHLGFFAAANESQRFKDLFTQAEATARLDSWRFAKMPASDSMPGLSGEEFEKLQKWVFRGMKGLDEAYAPPVDESCVAAVSDDLKAHVADMKVNGWSARHAEASVPMYGCAAGVSGKDCLATLPDLTATWGATGVDQTLRNLRTLSFNTHYWVRSSADGRYVGFGLSKGANILDLSQGAQIAPLDVAASYDPVFLPNNDGVSFAGAKADGSIRVCRQSVIGDAYNKTPRLLTMEETGCTTISDAVYQSFGAALDNSLFWMTTGDHANDDGGNDVTEPLPGFEQYASTDFTPMVSNGVSYQARPAITVNLPGEGDQMLSPSSKLMVTRFGQGDGKRGYRIRRLNVTGSNGQNLGLTTDVVGTVCVGGGKAMFSYDERFLVTHEYLDKAADPAQDVRAANIVLVDLATGEHLPITTMKPNQFALYPHFRADGWLYFLVRDMNSGAETLVASDAAIRRSSK